MEGVKVVLEMSWEEFPRGGSCRWEVEVKMRMRLEVGMQQGGGERSRSPKLSPSPANLLCSWEEDRKLVLRGWSLVFIFLATLLVFSVVDGRMAYVHGPYTGFIGLWIDCRRHKCANVGQVTGQCIGCGSY